MVKRVLNIGKIQLVIGILLLILSLASMIYIKENLKNDLEVNAGDFFKRVQDWNNQNFTSEEIKLITAVDSSQRYIIDDKYSRLNFVILESLSLVVFIMSILFITQGIINSRRT